MPTLIAGLMSCLHAQALSSTIGHDEGHVSRRRARAMLYAVPRHCAFAVCRRRRLVHGDTCCRHGVVGVFVFVVVVVAQRASADDSRAQSADREAAATSVEERHWRCAVGRRRRVARSTAARRAVDAVAARACQAAKEQQVDAGDIDCAATVASAAAAAAAAAAATFDCYR